MEKDRRGRGVGEKRNETESEKMGRFRLTQTNRWTQGMLSSRRMKRLRRMREVVDLQNLGVGWTMMAMPRASERGSLQRRTVRHVNVERQVSPE